MGKTKIEWADYVWNPVTGCTKASAGCAHCYAERFTKRIGGDFSKVELHPDRLDEPRTWREPSLVFVNSMSDLFHPKVPDAFLDDVFLRIAGFGRHTFQVLTKRMGRAMKYLRAPGAFVPCGSWPMRNLQVGVSVENEETKPRIQELLETKAAVRWLSIEPLLGPLDIRQELKTGRIHWVVVGGESGRGVARPMNPAWAKDLRDQAVEAGVPFLFKQWGEWFPKSQIASSWTGRDPRAVLDKFRQIEVDGERFLDIGKGAAGRLLDGKLWDEYPIGSPRPRKKKGTA